MMRIENLRTIWWTFNLKQPPPRTQIFLGVGMFKYQFARKVAEIYGYPEEALMVYRDTYGRAWWRITNPLLIEVTRKYRGKIVLFDKKTNEIVRVYNN